jgi:beta-N-acetylhexosaminidase
MALGATWDTNIASSVGQVLGKELSALGINLLLGPALDVLEDPNPNAGIDLDTSTFGGDPYWVGEMGRAYISSLHEGSDGKIAVIAKHFPGMGSADRLPAEEVATVRKSLEQLQNFDLVPFFSVTDSNASSESTADGLLVSHIRYQGFQGNIRATTRPISLDLQAFSQLMGLPALTSWRESGGVMVCDDLGTQAVRRFYDVTTPNQPFDARRVALNAFLAGNDLLYLGNIISGDDLDSYTSTLNVLAFFNQRYREDPDFAQRVDESALRILKLKYRLYPVFNLTLILPPMEGLAGLGGEDKVSFDVAKEAATLISPSLAELENALPDSPNATERIIFITDVRPSQQCSTCTQNDVPQLDAFQQAVMRLYGTPAGGQIRASNLTSYSFEDLQQLLDGDPDSFWMEKDLRRSQWQVFSLLDVNSRTPESRALLRFLDERPDLFQQKRLVVFAFNAPYYLDPTDISKISAYYALYSKIPSAFDVAARLLFKEIQPVGALPVSVEGIGYDLFSATMPDPSQVIPLALDLPETDAGNGMETPTLAPTPAYQVGDQVAIKAGIIRDHNGHPVPDGTPVSFIITLNGEIQSLPISEFSKGGMAKTQIQIPGPGAIEVRVESEPAKQSEILRFDVPGEELADVTETPTPEPTLTPTETQAPTIVPTLSSAQVPPPRARPNLLDWFAAMMIAIVAGFLSYKAAITMGQVRWGVRVGFLSAIGGLAAYTLLILAEAAGNDMLQSTGSWAVVLATLLGSAVGIFITLGWRAIHRQALGDKSAHNT